MVHLSMQLPGGDQVTVWLSGCLAGCVAGCLAVWLAVWLGLHGCV
jgi:hypothetical protein